MSRYLITGLPRSKTAWMSVVASSVRGSLCYHEPMSRLQSWECCFDLWKAQGRYSHVGVADAHLGFHVPEIMSRAAPRVLMIRREVAIVKQSLEVLGGIKSNYCDLLAAKLDQCRANPLVLTVDFEDLTNERAVIRCLDHLMPGCMPDAERIRQLLDLNIQADLDLVWARARAARPRVGEILGLDQMPGLEFYQ